jgi:WD40 repeat protein
MTTHPLLFTARASLAVILLALLLLVPETQPTTHATQAAVDSCDAPVQTVASRTVGVGDGMLNDIAAASDGLWAVGSTKIPGLRDPQPLVQRWDGSRWLTATTPVYASAATSFYGSGILKAVGILAANNIWAVGYIGQYEFYGDEALLLRWDGSTWARLPNSGPLSSFTQINDIAALTPTAIWVVGPTKSNLPAIVRWNGSTWNADVLPSGLQNVTLNALSGATPNDLWAVGSLLGGNSKPVVLRYNGSVWTSVPTPVAEGELFGLATGPGGAVWAVGSRFGAPLVLRWDGSQLQQVPTPDSLRSDAPQLKAVVVSSDTDVWAAGTGGAGGKLLHWDGTNWELFARKTEGYQSTGYNSLLTTSPGDLWAVGYYGAQRGRTLVERYQSQLSIGTARVVQEGDARAIALPLGLNAPAATTVRVTVRTEDAGAVAGRDYTAVNTTVTIPACDQGTTVLVPLISSANPPANAAFRLVIEGISGAGAEHVSRLVPLVGPQGVVALPLLSSPEPVATGRIAYTATTGGDGTNTNWDIFTVGVDGSARQQLTVAPGLDGSPAWSPDGRRIVFVSQRDGNANLYVMNADGSGQTPLTNTSSLEASPVFSPDGSRIAFISNRSGKSLIYVMSAQGGASTLLSPFETEITAGALSWSPDGSRIVFESTNTRRPGLFILGLDGSLRQLTDQANDTTPAWSPDGGQIVFFGTRGLLKGLYLIRPNGSGLREVNTNFDTDGSPSWSPNGQFIAYGFTSDGRVAISGLTQKAPVTVPVSNNNSFSPAWAPHP